MRYFGIDENHFQKSVEGILGKTRLPGRRTALEVVVPGGVKCGLANPAAIKNAYRNASIVGNSRVVFNVAGNKYRLVVKVNYAYRVMYIRFVGTHEEYDRIDVTEV